MTISKSAWRGVNRGSSAPKRSMSYGVHESDIYSIAQHAVANGYGKIENLRAHPIALSRRVSTAASPSRISSPFDDSGRCMMSAIDALGARVYVRMPGQKAIKQSVDGSTNPNGTTSPDEAKLALAPGWQGSAHFSLARQSHLLDPGDTRLWIMRRTRETR